MNLQKLQTQREGHRRFVDRYIIKIEQAKENSSLLEFNAILESIEAKVQILETLNEKILSNTEIECIEDEIFQAEEYSLQLEIKLRQLREFRNQQEKCSTTPLPREDQQTSREIHDQENSRESGDQQSLRERDGQRNGNASNSEDRYFNNRNVSNNSYNSAQFYRLPKISLPTFNGDILTWQSFWDSYESTIHMNNNLTDVQKFSYLKSQLEGKAAQVIEGFAMTNVNYIRAVDLLKERFGQQHKIMHVAMQSLLKLPAPSNRVTSLRNFYDKMETFIRSLEAMGQCQESYGSLLVPVVLEKLPSEIRKQLARENVENNWRLEDLRASINREICIMEAGTARSEPEVDDCEATAAFFMGAKSKRKPQHLAQSSSGRSYRKADIKCAFCEQGHKSVECKTHCDTNSRLDIVKQNRLCYNCLRKHPVAKCNSIKRCQICNRKHHTAICSRRHTAQQPNSYTTEITQTPEAGVFHSSAGLHGKGVLLKTAIATVSSTKVQLYTNILFDEGSHKSFITESLAEELELTRNGTETIYLSSFGSTSNKIMQVDTATVYLVTDECQKIPVKVLIVPTISTPINNRLQNTASKLPYLRGLKLAHPVTEDSNFTISMLIGADFYWDIVEDRIIRGEGPTAVKSKIGYLLSGPVPAESAHSTNHVCNVNTSHFSPDMLERFWSLESMGITQTTEDNDKSDYFKNYQQSCIEFKDSRYSAKLPWKLEHPPLPTNYEVTKKRTENTIRRLQRDPYLLKKYDDIITEQERRGFIEKVITDTPPTGQVHYIPHHPVRKESSTTPIRIVYDCSCRQSPNLPSLNDCLESTPPILNDLSNILVRFRLHKYAVTADIEKAFLHVGLDERDRDATRFLWSGDILNPSSPLCIYRFKAVLFGATCSPFMLSATILKHLELNKHVQAAEVIQRDLYVDNVLSSFESESSACTYFKEARCLMRKAGMNLRSWTSNSEKLRSLAAADGVLDNDVIIKVLGMQWNPNTDELSFTNRSIPSLDVITKRTILKFSSQIYDPLGLLSPVTVRAKILLQELWKSKYDWDIFLPEVITDSWNQLAEDLNRVTDVKFSRQLLPTQNPNSTTCLHIFVDASIKSYGAVAYFSNEKQTRILMAKNRVAPLKTLTLPQLELMAALIGARLASHLQKSLQTPNVTFWSDSQIVLHWLTTSKPLKRFVRNRVDEINQLTGKSLWRYCPTNDNPADLLTRGISADIFLDNQLWNTGPSWLTNRVQWPTWEYEHVTPQTTTEENAGNSEEINVSSLQCSDTLGIHNVIDITHYSSYTKLLRVTANVMRFIHNCRQNTNRQTGSLLASELHDAEIPWLRSCHATSFKEEIENLKGNRNRLPLVRQLRLYLDTDGLIRCGGRIHNAPLEYATKFPYLLPKKHKLTRLVIQDAHGKQLHSGVNATITHLRQKYWIPAIRQCVRSVLRTCVICTRVIGKPYRAPDQVWILLVCFTSGTKPEVSPNVTSAYSHAQLQGPFTWK